MKCSRQRPKSYDREKAGTFQQIFALNKMVKFSYPEAAGFLKKTKTREISIKCNKCCWHQASYSGLPLKPAYFLVCPQRKKNRGEN